jgi:predicted rRNA methylase YqxC with S4 and FtsJ domains
MRMEYIKRERMKMNREEVLKKIVISSIGKRLSLEENEWHYKSKGETKRQS